MKERWDERFPAVDFLNRFLRRVSSQSVGAEQQPTTTQPPLAAASFSSDWWSSLPKHFEGTFEALILGCYNPRPLT